MALLLRGTSTPGRRVYVAPLDVRLGGDTMVQPDVLVVPHQLLATPTD